MDLEPQVESIIEHVFVLSELAHGNELTAQQLADYGFDPADELDFWTAIDSLVLEARVTYEGGLGQSRTDAEIESVRLVFGTGGPHTEAIIKDSGDTVANVYWGSDRIEGRYIGRYNNLFEILTEVV